MPTPATPRVDLYDTTLRDGTQREGLSLSLRDKIRVAERLGAFGVAFIEAGWPGSNPKDMGFFQAVRGKSFGRAHLVAFGSTCRPRVAPEDDLQLRALLDAETPVCTLFGKASLRHVHEVLRTTPEENLMMIERSIAHLRSRGRRVFFDAEHFYDGFAADSEYALETLRAAQRGGAEVVILCDTNGGTLPSQVAAATRRVRTEVSLPIGIHAHDDCGCAVASSMAAVESGATQVQGTINGYGERCGNANLVTVAANLELKLGTGCVGESLSQLRSLSRFVSDVANLPPNDHAPYVGRSAFAHKGGVHVSAIRRDPGSYEHCDPARVGNETRVVVSELSGRANVLSKAEELGLSVGGVEGRVLQSIKTREARGYAFEAAEASVALLVDRARVDYLPPFVVLEYRTSARRERGRPARSEATVKIAAQGEERIAAGEGCGPVAALDTALRQALLPLFPALGRVTLSDYRVRILDGTDGTDATTRVLVECRSEEDGDTDRWTTVGASPDIVEASIEALADGYEFGLVHALREGAGAGDAALPPEDIAKEKLA